MNYAKPFLAKYAKKIQFETIKFNVIFIFYITQPVHKISWNTMKHHETPRLREVTLLRNQIIKHQETPRNTTTKGDYS